MSAKQRKKSVSKSQKAKATRGKEVPASESPESTDNQTICWQFCKMDWDGPWGNTSLKKMTLDALLKKVLAQFDNMTWAEIFRASGGRKNGNNNHPVRVQDLSKTARDRLEKISLSDQESLISLRVQSKIRIYGIRDRRAFQFLWYDPWHDDHAKAVYPSGQKR